MYVNRWIETHAHIRPNKVALIDRVSGVSSTYLDLQRASHLQAYRLASLGVKAGDRVAVYSQNRPEVLELLLACGLLGACLVPLNWRLTPQELEKIVADCQPKITFVEPGLAGGEALEAQSIFSLQTVDAEPVELPGVSPDSALAIFYTGGTISRWEGALFLGYYGLYTAYLILNAIRHGALATFQAALLWFVIPLTVVTLAVSVGHAFKRRQKERP